MIRKDRNRQLTEDIQIAKNIFQCVPLPTRNKVQIKTRPPFRLTDLQRWREACRLIAALCSEVGPLVSHWGSVCGDSLLEAVWPCVPWAWKIFSPFDPGIPCLGSDPEETFGVADSDLCSRVLTTALFIIANNGKQPQCLTIGNS